MLALGSQPAGLPGLGDPSDTWYRTDLARDVYKGRELAAEVLEAGPDTVAPTPGTIVTSIPALLAPTGIRDLAYGNDLPGSSSERMLLSAPLLLTVPNGLDPKHAASTEPMAVGLHAVNRSRIAPGGGAVVLGCGPVEHVAANLAEDPRHAADR